MNAQYDYALLKSCGEDTFISGNVEIRRPHLVQVGSHTAIDTGFYCTVSAEICDYVHIAPYISVIGGATGFWKMNHFSTLAAGSRIICGSDDHMGEGLVGPTIPEQYKDHLTIAPVIFEKFANIGTGVVVMPGVTLAEGCVVGANSLVTKSTEPWMVYVGSPARPVKARPREKMLDYARRLGYEV
jgi:acetyltransferase-like isoleucine patch superfamily enzyme